MSLFILKANDSEDMDRISAELLENKFKIIEKQDNFILMKRRRYGNVLIHVVCLIVALMFLSVAIFINVIYFTYSFLWASPNVLITTETKGEDGEDLQFNTMDEVMMKATAIL
jgi:hypothetical protein